MWHVIWTLEGFDRQTDVLVESIPLPSSISEEDISAALGNPECVKCGTWPVTRELMEVIDERIGRDIRWQDLDFFVTYLRYNL